MVTRRTIPYSKGLRRKGRTFRRIHQTRRKFATFMFRFALLVTKTQSRYNMTHWLAAKTVLAVALLTCLLPWVLTAQDVVNSPYVVSGATGNVPSLAVFNGKLFMAWTGTDSNHSINVAESYDGLHFGSPVVFLNNSSVWYAAPAIAAFNGKLYLTWTGYWAHINIASSTDGLHFSHQSLVTDPNTGAVQTANGSTALAAVNGKLYVAWSGTDGVNTINVATSTDGVHFTHPYLYTELGHGSPWSPALGANNHGMTVAFTSVPVGEQPCRRVYGLPVPGSGGGISFLLPACPPGSYNTGPGLGALGTETFVIWVGTAQADEVIIDAFGTTHTETHTGQTAIGNPAIVGFNGHVYYAWTGTDGAHTINVAQFQ